jgi:hypothetical protein
MGKKGKCSWVGSKCHVVETARRGEINFITNMIYQEANGHDGDVHDEVRAGNDRLGLSPEKLYADSNYVSGAWIKSYRDHGQELMGYVQEYYTGRDPAFDTEAFEIDFEKHEAVCPAGHRSVKKGVEKPDVIKIRFDYKTCTKCEYFYPCVAKNNTKAKSRVVKLRPFYEIRRERRFTQRTKEFRNEMRVRAQVEGTISEATRMHGLRYSRYRGRMGHQLQFYFVGAALNMRRFTKAIAERYRTENKEAA